LVLKFKFYALQVYRTIFCEQSMKTSLECVYWDFELSRWSRDGCCLVKSSNGTAECLCNHLTNFALLVVSFMNT